MIPCLLPLLLCLATPPLKDAAPPPKGPGIQAHKAKLPIDVSATFSEMKATVTLRFERSVSEAKVVFRGLDGLTVHHQPALTKTTFERGEFLKLDVPLSPGPGRSHLVVDLEGRFDNQRRAEVRTFATGKPSPEQRKASGDRALKTSDGRRLKLMPSKNP